MAPGPSFWLPIKETEPLPQFNCNKVTQNNCHNCSNAQIKKFAPTWQRPPSKSRRKRFVQLWPSFTAEWNEKSQITSCPERTLQLPSSRCFLRVYCHLFSVLTREVRTFFLRYQNPLSEVSSDRGTTRESISVLFRRCPLWRSEIITLFWVRRKTKLPKVTHGHHLAHFHSFFFLSVPLDPSFWTLGASGLAEVYWAQKRCRAATSRQRTSGEWCRFVFLWN